ncbi:hypothetical protein [Sporosarcina sp. FA9]|uniref:hypothetical protein n=1 Tax=Sporosarcina sp. FA9 TaxID=3413030 RepID=UPI003F6609A5
MHKFKKCVLLVLSKLGVGGRYLFSKFLNAADDSITKMLFILKENKEQLNDYLVDRKILLHSIKQKQVEVESLRLKIAETDKSDKDQTGRLIRLYEKLELKTDELAHYKQEYHDVQQSIEASKKEIHTLTDEKNQVLDNRNGLKLEYDQLRIVMEENLFKQKRLEDELSRLKKKQTEFDSADVENSTKKEIEEKMKEIEVLQQDKHIYEDKFKKVEQDLMREVKRVAKLSGRLQTVQQKLHGNEQVMINFENTIHTKTEQVRIDRQKIEQLTAERVVWQEQLDSNQEDHQIALLELQDIGQKLSLKDDEYTAQAIKSEEKIEQLKTELLNEKNDFALLSATKGAPAEITVEALRILEREYEPRFQTLYAGSKFHQSFYKDFFSLVPPDRLKVEAIIANLERNFDQAIIKTRENTIKTHSGETINEYPFGADHAGRIYLKENNNKVEYFRISRTKNGRGTLDQKKVIAWLKANV